MAHSRGEVSHRSREVHKTIKEISTSEVAWRLLDEKSSLGPGK